VEPLGKGAEFSDRHSAEVKKLVSRANIVKNRGKSKAIGEDEKRVIIRLENLKDYRKDQVKGTAQETVDMLRE